MLDDWTNTTFDPFASPEETEGAVGPQERQQHRRRDAASGRRPAHGRRARRRAIRTDATHPVNRMFADVSQDEPEVHANPGFEDEVAGFSLYAYLSRSDVTWNPSVTSVCKDSLFCPTTEEYILPIIHGNDRVEWFVQLSDEIRWNVDDRDTGSPRAKVIMRAGDVAAMPADIRHRGYSPKRSMLLVWENASPELPELIATGKAPAIPDRLLRTGPMVATKLFIGNEFVDSVDGATVEVIDPHDCSVIADVAEARAADVDRAVDAAQTPSPPGRRWPPPNGAGCSFASPTPSRPMPRSLRRWRAGTPVIRSATPRGLDVPRTAGCFRYFGGIADKVQGDVIPVEPGFLNYVTREPLGVVGAIVPWNFPLMFCSWKLGPALAAGNTAVMKPSEITPLSALRLAELMVEVGFPPGVVNIVPGYGNTAGEAIATHDGIAKVAFTGSTVVGRRIVEYSAGNLKRVQLELGGKGANIVFEDADLGAAVNGAAFAIFHNQGQACIAGSRLILHEAIAEDFLEHFVALARSIRLGNPLDPDTEMGPLTSPLHRDRVLSYVKVALDEGAEILTGGRPPDDASLARGCYIEPTVVRAATRGDRICTEEVFGPFATVLTFADDDEAVAIANSVDYGLGGGLWTRDVGRAHRVASELRAGMVWVNSYKRVSPASPFGGTGLSGYGREMGFEAMHEYTESKSVWINVDAQIPAWYQR